MGCPTNEALREHAERSRDPAPTLNIELDEHLATCALCRSVIEDVFASGPTALARGTDDQTLARGTMPTGGASVGGDAPVALGDRYEVKQMLGRGGMGAVYLARDRTLGRDVAVKLHGAGSGGDRLHREAIAMAKLAHPNVVTVYEVSSFEDRLFVAMEYVRGGTLLTWLRATPRTWRDIVEIMLATGEGLAAAHDAELVHRDFKPENVLVGEDGRPRVGDFGIAHVAGRSSDQLLSVTPDVDLTKPMTMTGSVMGTPAYMAPEQISGEEVDARADQFAFCVVTWELLYGRRPFGGNSLPALAANIALHKLDRPVKSAVPQRVADVLARGLAQEPADRYSNVRVLLAALRRTVRRPRGAWIAATIAGGAGAAAIAAFLIAKNTAAGPTVDSCVGGPEQLAGVWDPTVKATMSETFVADRPQDGEDIHTRVASKLDTYAQDWMAGRRAACESSLRGNQSDSAFDLRMQCLDSRRTELAAFTIGLSEAKGPQVIGAPRSVLGLSPIDSCANVPALSAPTRAPDIVVRARVWGLRGQLSGLRAQRLLGKIKAARPVADFVAEQAIELKYRPLEAEALMLAGDLADRMGDADVAMKLTEQAAAAANAGNSKLVAAEAWTQLVWMLSQRERETERALTAVKMASAAIESAGGDRRLATQLQGYEALVYQTAGKRPEAKQKFIAAIAAYEQLHDEANLSVMLNDFGGLQREMGEYEEARKTHERALEMRTRLLGEHHPWVFSSVLNIGNVSFSQSDYRGAVASYERALAIGAAVFPAKHPQLALAMGNLASAYNELGDRTKAIATQRRALAMTEALRGPEHPSVAQASYNLGMFLADDEKLPEAKEAYGRALEIMNDRDDDPMLVDILSLYGELMIQLDPKAAEPMLLRALKNGESIAKDSPELALPMTLLGRLYATTGRPALARPLLERAVALRVADKAAAPTDIAVSEYELAKVLWEAPLDRPRALELVTDGVKRMNDSGETKKPVYAEINAWLAAHSKR